MTFSKVIVILITTLYQNSSFFFTSSPTSDVQHLIDFAHSVSSVPNVPSSGIYVDCALTYFQSLPGDRW